MKVTITPPKKERLVTIEMKESEAKFLRELLGSMSIHDWQTKADCTYEDGVQMEKLWNALDDDL